MRYSDRVADGGVRARALLSALGSKLERELQGRGIDSIDELMRLYELRGSDETTLEIVATSVASFTEECQLQGCRVVLGLRLAHGLDREQFNVVVRNASSNALEIPRSLRGPEVNWTAHSKCLTV